MTDGLASEAWGTSAALGTSVAEVAEGEQRPVLEILLRDRGMGIPSDHLGRIFDRFHQVETRLTREVGGLGLGLAICQRIVALHEGAIWAESARATGSTLHLLLPTLPALPAEVRDEHGDLLDGAHEER